MPAQLPRTRWGGIAEGRLRASGFFRVVKSNDVFWLVDPDGGLLLSKGVNTVRIDQDRIGGTDRTPYADSCRRKYGTEQSWRAAAAARLANLGFNTLGAWSDETVAKAGPKPLAVAPNLDLGMSFAWGKNDAADGTHQDFPDVFDTGFETHTRARAAQLCTERRNDQNIIGWFIDNELRWSPDWRGTDELLGLFLNLRPGTPGRAAALTWLRERHPDFAAFNAIWRTPAQSWETIDRVPRIESPYRRDPIYLRKADDEDAANRANPAHAAFVADCDGFARVVAERYFAITCEGIRAADPHHLVLGCRFAYVPPSGAIDAAARHCDVISLNCYDVDAGPVIDSYGESRPCLIGEFSIRSIDSGLPNTNGAGPLVASQADRAKSFRHYVTAALRKPAIVGFHWFEHADQPAEGRFDGENSNFGIVSIEDELYEELAHTMESVNQGAEIHHGLAVKVS
jgi:agarase